MVQDYRRCSRNCLDASGQPADLNSRDTTVVPYGEFGDFYVRRWDYCSTATKPGCRWSIAQCNLASTQLMHCNTKSDVLAYVTTYRMLAACTCMPCHSQVELLLICQAMYDAACLCRELLLAAVDSDFYQQFMNASLTAELRGSRGNYGFDVSTLDAAASAATLLSSTVPSDSGFLCNLGQPRKRLQAIRILSRACYVQVVSAPGAGYQLYMRTHKE